MVINCACFLSENCMWKCVCDPVPQSQWPCGIHPGAFPSEKEVHKALPGENNSRSRAKILIWTPPRGNYPIKCTPNFYSYARENFSYLSPSASPPPGKNLSWISNLTRFCVHPGENSYPYPDENLCLLQSSVQKFLHLPANSPSGIPTLAKIQGLAGSPTHGCVVSYHSLQRWIRKTMVFWKRN